MSIVKIWNKRVIHDRMNECTKAHEGAFPAFKGVFHVTVNLIQLSYLTCFFNIYSIVFSVPKQTQKKCQKFFSKNHTTRNFSHFTIITEVCHSVEICQKKLNLIKDKLPFKSVLSPLQFLVNFPLLSIW